MAVSPSYRNPPATRVSDEVLCKNLRMTSGIASLPIHQRHANQPHDDLLGLRFQGDAFQLDPAVNASRTGSPAIGAAVGRSAAESSADKTHRGCSRSRRGCPARSGGIRAEGIASNRRTGESIPDLDHAVSIVHPQHGIGNAALHGIAGTQTRTNASLPSDREGNLGRPVVPLRSEADVRLSPDQKNGTPWGTMICPAAVRRVQRQCACRRDDAFRRGVENRFRQNAGSVSVDAALGGLRRGPRR